MAHHTDSRARTSERGFTLIELVIAGTLGAICIGLAVSVLVDGFGQSRKLDNNARVRIITDELTGLLGQDVREMRAPHRSADYIRNPDDLQDKVRTGSAPAIDGANLDVQDIVEATPRVLTFIADVDAAAGFECVRWEQTVSASGWGIERSLWQYSTANRCNSPTGVRTRTILDPRDTRVTGPAPAGVFGYVLRCVDSASCITAPPRPVSCDGVLVSTSALTTTEEMWVTEVRVNLAGVIGTERENAKSDVENSVALRTRAVTDYQYALGCGGVQQ